MDIVCLTVISTFHNLVQVEQCKKWNIDKTEFFTM